MEIWVWLAIAIVVVAIVFYVVSGRKPPKSTDGIDADEARAWAAGEFRRSYPDEHVVTVISDDDLTAFFLKLTDSKVGILRTLRGKRRALIVNQADYRLRALPEANGLQVDFPENDYFSGNYHFDSEEDAADVSTWLLNAR